MKTWVYILIGVLGVGAIVALVLYFSPKKVVVKETAPAKPTNNYQPGGLTTTEDGKITALDWVVAIAETGLIEGLVGGISGLFKKDGGKDKAKEASEVSGAPSGAENLA